MPKPLPIELRQRVVDAYNNGEGTYEELADRFQVGRATVNRWLQRARVGKLEPGKKGPVPTLRKLKHEHLDFLRQTILAVPDSSAAELTQGLLEEFGLVVSPTTVGRARRKLGFTPKRGSGGRQSAIGKTSWTPGKSG